MIKWDGVGLDEPRMRSCRSNDERVMVEEGSNKNGAQGMSTGKSDAARSDEDAPAPRSGW